MYTLDRESMTDSSAACFVPFSVGALLITLSGCVGTASTDVFTAYSGNARLTLSCEGAVVVDSPCKIEIGRGSVGEAIPVRFTTRPTRYAHLLKEGLERAI